MNTDFIEVEGIRVATRTAGSGPRLVLLHRFRGTLDDWDPALVSALAGDHEVRMFDSVGVGQTGGALPATVEGMADFAARFLDGLGDEPTDILGWSLGGFVAQVLALKYPWLVRRLILAGTMPPGGVPGAEWSHEWLERASAPVPTAENALALFYTASAASRQAGAALFGRMPQPPAAYVAPEAMAVQANAIRHFADGEEGDWSVRLHHIAAPTFVANGDRDGLFPAIDSVVLARAIPNARLAVYPDSGHAFLFQYAERFANDVREFLESREPALSKP